MKEDDNVRSSAHGSTEESGPSPFVNIMASIASAHPIAPDAHDRNILLENFG
jgi:hypothetical protein